MATHKIRLRLPIMVQVDWMDACDRSMECDLDEVGELVKLEPRHTCGFLAYADEEKIVLAHDADPDRKVGNFTAIPTSWVVRIRRTGGKVIYVRTK